MSRDKDEDRGRRPTNEGTWANQSFQNVEESHGRCARFKMCKTTGVLGNGLCQECWDKGWGAAKRIYRGRTRK